MPYFLKQFFLFAVYYKLFWVELFFSIWQIDQANIASVRPLLSEYQERAGTLSSYMWRARMFQIYSAQLVPCRVRGVD